MKKSSYVHFATFVFPLLTALPAQSADAQKNPQLAVVHIETYDHNELVGEASGFIVDSSGIIVTAKHVATDLRGHFNDQLKFKIGFSKSERHVDAYFETADETTDIAILVFDPDLQNSVNKTWPSLCLDTSTRNLKSERIVAFGFSGDLGNLITGGTVNSARRHGAQYVTDAAFEKGMSGGPVMNADRTRVVGVISGGWRGRVLRNFVSIRPALAMIERIVEMNPCSDDNQNSVPPPTITAAPAIAPPPTFVPTNDPFAHNYCSWLTDQIEVATRDGLESQKNGSLQPDYTFPDGNTQLYFRYKGNPFGDHAKCQILQQRSGKTGQLDSNLLLCEFVAVDRPTLVTAAIAVNKAIENLSCVPNLRFSSQHCMAADKSNCVYWSSFLLGRNRSFSINARAAEQNNGQLSLTFETLIYGETVN